MRVLVAGATGSIGTPLVKTLLSNGDTVTVVGRSKEKLIETFGDVVFAETWEGLTDEHMLTLDAVINLAGENVGGVMWWTTDYMNKILDSRLETTTKIAQRLVQSGSTARLLNSSGISIYGHQEYDDQDIKDEDSTVPQTHSDFLTNVVIQWESAATSVVPENQLVLLRTGIVLCAGGGALGKMELPFKIGLGGRLGPGTQAMSWISLEDSVKAICFILRHPEIKGPVNLVADFVPQIEFAGALASALHRPCLLPAPSFALRMALGSEMAQNLVLVNHRIRAKRLRDAGFEFGDVDIGTVLTSLYSKDDEAPTAMQETFLGSVHVTVTKLSGDVVGELDPDAGMQVRSLEKQVFDLMQLGPLMRISLVHEGQVLSDKGPTLATAGLVPMQTVVLVVLVRDRQHFILDDCKKGEGIVFPDPDDLLLVRNTTRHHVPYNPESDHTILAKEPLPDGIHEFRVRLVSGSYYYIGVAEQGVDLDFWLGGKPHGWAYYIRDNATRSAVNREGGGSGSDFGPRLHPGDAVTVRVDTTAGTMHCARNDDAMQVAFSGLEGKELYLALGMGPNDVTLRLEAAQTEP